MKCNNKLCAHNFGYECELEKIEIDWRGNCDNMKYICFTQDATHSSRFYTHLMINNNFSFDKTTGEYKKIKD